MRWLVVAAEPVTSVDVTAGDTIAEKLDEVLHAQGIEFCFAELKDPVKDKLKRFGLFAQLGENQLFPDPWRSRFPLPGNQQGCGLAGLGGPGVNVRSARWV